MADDITPPEPPSEPPDPMAMLAFLQRMMSTVSEGGDVEALMAEAPPGFAELFADAERRVEAGEMPDLGRVLGMFGGEEEEEGERGG